MCALRDRMRFSVSLTSQPESLGTQMGLQGVPVVGHLGFHDAWKNLGVRLILAIGLAGLLNAPGFALQSAPEAQSKKAETKVEGKVCTAAGAAVADALVSLVNGAEEKLQKLRRMAMETILVAQPGSTGWKPGRIDSARSNGIGWAGPRRGPALEISYGNVGAGKGWCRDG